MVFIHKMLLGIKYKTEDRVKKLSEKKFLLRRYCLRYENAKTNETRDALSKQSIYERVGMKGEKNERERGAMKTTEIKRCA